MPLLIRCNNPACHIRIQVKDSLAGKRLKCPKCSTMLHAIPARITVSPTKSPTSETPPASPELNNNQPPNTHVPYVSALMRKLGWENSQMRAVGFFVVVCLSFLTVIEGVFFEVLPENFWIHLLITSIAIAALLVPSCRTIASVVLVMFLELFVFLVFGEIVREIPESWIRWSFLLLFGAAVLRLLVLCPPRTPSPAPDRATKSVWSLKAATRHFAIGICFVLVGLRLGTFEWMWQTSQMGFQRVEEFGGLEFQLVTTRDEKLFVGLMVGASAVSYLIPICFFGYSLLCTLGAMLHFTGHHPERPGIPAPKIANEKP